LCNAAGKAEPAIGGLFGAFSAAKAERDLLRKGGREAKVIFIIYYKTCLNGIYMFKHVFYYYYELLFICKRTSSATFVIRVGWPPHFVGVKPQVYVSMY
jgi:hypothetical protein